MDEAGNKNLISKSVKGSLINKLHTQTEKSIDKKKYMKLSENSSADQLLKKNQCKGKNRYLKPDHYDT